MAFDSTHAKERLYGIASDSLHNEANIRNNWLALFNSIVGKNVQEWYGKRDRRPKNCLTTSKMKIKRECDIENRVRVKELEWERDKHTLK